MTPGRCCTAVRTPLPHATPEPGTDVTTKPHAENASIIQSVDVARNQMQKPSRITVAIIGSRKLSRELCSTNLLDERLSGGKMPPTCTDTTRARISGKGVATAAHERYRFINFASDAAYPGGNPMTRSTVMPKNSAGGDT